MSARIGPDQGGELKSPQTRARDVQAGLASASARSCRWCRPPAWGPERGVRVRDDQRHGQAREPELRNDRRRAVGREPHDERAARGRPQRVRDQVRRRVALAADELPAGEDAVE
jgi:hypothetical protein